MSKAIFERSEKPLKIVGFEETSNQKIVRVLLNNGKKCLTSIKHFVPTEGGLDFIGQDEEGFVIAEFQLRDNWLTKTTESDLSNLTQQLLGE